MISIFGQWNMLRDKITFKQQLFLIDLLDPIGVNDILFINNIVEEYHHSKGLQQINQISANISTFDDYNTFFREL